jgi:hypothetical protein
MSKPERESSPEDEEPTDTDHLDSIADGCGCVEVWETLSENRQRSD